MPGDRCDKCGNVIYDVATANHALTAGHPGYYVTNVDTSLAVAGPFASRTEAVDAKRAIDRRWPNTPDVLLIVAEKPDAR